MKYFSPDEIGEQFNVKPGTVRKWIADGKLKALKLGGLLRISEESLQKFIEGKKDSE
jgi:excisionase family DNA binding protein